MMELTKQRLLNNIGFLILIFMLLNSCNKKIQSGKLECILDSIKVDVNEMDIEVGQHNGWTDTTTLILVTYHRKSMDISIGSKLKGVYKGSDIYFYQSIVDSLDTKKYRQIPNNIIWNDFIPKKIDKNIIQPPYDPINIQIEYNTKKECIGDVIKGKGYLNGKIISECKCPAGATSEEE
jgi:hypothetical protein